MSTKTTWVGWGKGLSIGVCASCRTRTRSGLSAGPAQPRAKSGRSAARSLTHLARWCPGHRRLFSHAPTPCCRCTTGASAEAWRSTEPGLASRPSQNLARAVPAGSQPWSTACAARRQTPKPAAFLTCNLIDSLYRSCVQLSCGRRSTQRMRQLASGSHARRIPSETSAWCTQVGAPQCWQPP